MTKRAFLLLSSALAIVAGCNGSPVAPTTCTTNADCHGGEVCIDSHCHAPTDSGPMHADGGPLVDAPQRTVTGIAITPTTATLTSTDGSQPTQLFTAHFVFDDGTMAPATGTTWSIADTRLGPLAPSATAADQATFTSDGLAGGTEVVTVTATGAGGAAIHATAMLTVQVVRTIVTPGAPADSATRFMTATMSTTGPGAGVVYPLDGAVMPNNVAPPDVQWLNGAMGDLYRITITKPDLTITAYVLHTGAAFHDDWVVDAGAWRAVAESDPGASVSITVDRLAASGMQIEPGTAIHVRLTQQGVFGAVYYWAINEGRLLRINADTATRDNFMPSPPHGCVACHSISRDGRYLVGALDGSPRTMAVFDLTQDLSASPAPTVFSSSLAYVFSTFSLDGTRILATGFGADNGSGSDGFVLINAATGATALSSGLPTSHHVTHAEWSPDGNSVAYVGNVSGSTSGYPEHFTSSDLFTMSVTNGTTTAFGAPAMISAGADLMNDTPNGGAYAHPTWSPDSRLLAVQHGPVAYSQFNPYDALYVITPTAGSHAVRLDAANGGPTGTSAFWPTFAPYETNDGGTNHYWLAFFSQRDYGNAQAGTRGTMRRQLWVTAIQASGATGDPSSVPYWLPGQDTASENAAAHWAPAACRTDGATCAVSSECCSGECLPDPTMPSTFTCQPPPAMQCHTVGMLCGGSGDCCTGLSCIGNACGLPPS
jgi:hypothetical protein